MWTPGDAPAHGEPGDGTASVEIDVRFLRPMVKAAGLVQLLFFHASDLPLLGTEEFADRGRIFCCTPELLSWGLTGCESVGRMIVRQPDELEQGTSARKWEIWLRDVPFAVNESSSAVTAHVPIVQSGVHYLLFSSCEPRTGDVLISGQTAWLNPYGYLPGELFPFLPFFAMMLVAYIIVTCVWLVLCIKHRPLLLPLQQYIGGVLLLGTFETLIWYLDYRSFNAGGTRGVAPVVLGVFLSTVKKVVSRLLVLAVCLGYGVVRPTLGSVAYKVLALGVVYLTFSAVVDVASNISQMSEMSVSLRVFFILPIALLDSFFYWWVFSGLNRTLSQLSTRRQSAKLLLYRRFSHILLISICISGIWVGWQLIVIISDTLDSRWAYLWMFDAFWHLLYLGILLAVCCLWSPSKNNLQYAYMDELGQSEEEEEEEADPADEQHYKA